MMTWMWGPKDPKAEAQSGDCTDAITITTQQTGKSNDQVVMSPSADVAVHGLLLHCD